MSDDKNNANGITDPMKMRDTDTGNMTRMAAQSEPAAPASVNNQARRTIKLKPLTAKKESAAATTMAPAAPPEDDATVAVPRNEVDEEATLKMQKVPAAAVPPVSAVPGTKQTIKLRPSSISSSAPQAGSADRTDAARPASAPTIKLTPKTEAETGAAPEEDEEKTVAMAKQTIKLVPKSAGPQAAVTTAAPSVAPSAQTVSMDETSKIKPSDPTVKLGGTPAAEQQAPSRAKLTIKRHSSDASSSMPASAKSEEVKTSAGMEAEGEPLQGEAGEEVSGGADEPSMIFAIAACLSLILIGYILFTFMGQYMNQWMDKDINVPGLTRLITK